MVDSELYEDAQSKIGFYSKSNSMSMYQDAQSKINNYSKKITSKRSESSIYQDAQSRITNNSRISSNRHKNSISKISSGKNNIVNKNDFLKINNIYKDDKLENNEEEKIKSRNLIAQKKYEEDKLEDINNNINYIKILLITIATKKAVKPLDTLVPSFNLSLSKICKKSFF